MMLASVLFYYVSYRLKYTAEIGGNIPLLRKSTRFWYIATICAVFGFSSFLLIGVVEMLNQV